MSDQLRMPDGHVLTKEQMKEGLVKGVADEFRKARNDGYRTSDWIKSAAEKVVDHLFEMDAYFDQMLELQKVIAGKSKGNKITQIFKPKQDETAKPPQPV